MQTSESLGKTIKINRKKIGLTQKELADKLFVSEKTISRWECGVGYPSLYDLEKLSEVLQIDFNSFVGISTNLEHNASQIKEKKRINIPILLSAADCIISIVLFLLLFLISDRERNIPIIYDAVLFKLEGFYLILSLLLISFLLLSLFSSLILLIVKLIAAKEIIQKITTAIRLSFAVLCMIIAIVCCSIRFSYTNIIGFYTFHLTSFSLLLLLFNLSLFKSNKAFFISIIIPSFYLLIIGGYFSSIFAMNFQGEYFKVFVTRLILFVYIVLVPFAGVFLLSWKRIKNIFVFLSVNIVCLSIFIIGYIGLLPHTYFIILTIISIITGLIISPLSFSISILKKYI